MRFFTKFFLLLVILFASTGNILERVDYREGISNNVCKKLSDKVLVYCIFVDSQKTLPWSEFDMQSTLDSLNVAIKWIENMAAKNGIKLSIMKDYYIGEEYSTIKKELPSGSVINSFSGKNLNKGLNELNLWADNIAKRVGTTFHLTEKEGIPEIKNPRSKERIIAYLRDEKQVENVALLYMINNYFKNDISVTLNTLNSDDVEFSIVSYKYPSVIANCILQLFGAADMYETPFRKNEKKIALAKEFFPNDIMQEPYGKSINSLEIGEFTKYLIGWSPELDEKFYPLLSDRTSIF